MDRLLTIKDVSSLLRKGDKPSRFVYDLAKKKIIPSIKIGGKVLFKQCDVEDFIEKQFRLQK